MDKFENKTRKLSDTKLVKSIRLYKDEWLAAKKIHPKFSAFARRAVLEKIEREEEEESLIKDINHER